MKVVSLEEVKQMGRVATCPNGGFESFRYLLGKDGMGFSLTLTKIPKGPPQFWKYLNHVEACLCIGGRGTLIEKESGQSWDITPGTMYAPDNHDPHTFEALEDVSLVCVFNPQLFGSETHD